MEHSFVKLGGTSACRRLLRYNIENYPWAHGKQEGASSIGDILASVDGQDRACAKPGFGRGEIAHRFGDLIWFA
tara:strand:+ start:343 stop:564 length:222 start_codon:yes stop_codon:yes gene_type:complete